MPIYEINRFLGKVPLSKKVLEFLNNNKNDCVIENKVNKLTKFLKKEDVIVNGYSEELDAEYFAEYRQLDKEIKLLKQVGFSKVLLFDEVSGELNVWGNTKHLYFVCYK